MSRLVYSEISSEALDRAQANPTTNAAFTAAQIARLINDAYADVWEAEGGSMKRVASATAWTSAQLATGVVAGILTDTNDIISVFSSTTSGSTGYSTGDEELDRVELEVIQACRSASGLGTYARPKMYAVSRMATVTPADVGKLQLDYFPNVTGFYLPTHYQANFTPIDSATVTTPDVSDLGSRDIMLLTAAKMAPLNQRPELVEGILRDISDRNAALRERKLKALVSADQGE